MTLCVMWRFYIQKDIHFAKTKTICDTFLYTKIQHFSFCGFYCFFEICGEGGYLLKKQCTLRDIFILKKQCTLRYVDIYTKYKTLCAKF